VAYEGERDRPTLVELKARRVMFAEFVVIPYVVVLLTARGD
jgi:hypothetical protein